MSSQAIIGLGSNLGQRHQYLANALEAINASPGTRVLGVSSIYETAPVGFTEQPFFLNAVGAIETKLSPEEILEKLFAIEDANGRVRALPNGPRTLDLDLLFFENAVRATARLTLPHPRFAERAFVCAPLAEVLALPPLRENKHWDDLRAMLAAKTNFEGVTLWKISPPGTTH